jgi:RNA polymerase sigma-70 factor (ECF subfamily)
VRGIDRTPHPAPPLSSRHTAAHAPPRSSSSALRPGDRRALDDLLRAIQPELFGYLSRLLHNHALAEDVLQDTLFIICRQLRFLREPRFFRTWAYRIATREGLRRVRSRPETAPLDPDSPSDPASHTAPPDLAADRETVEKLLTKIDALPPNSRAVILLHYIAGMSLSAAAAAMDVPEGTAKSRLAYALTLLRRATGADP